MTAILVEALEVVDVEQYDRQRAALAPSALQLDPERLLEAAVVGQAGQRVAVGELLQPPAALLQPGGHRVEVAREVAQLVVAAPAQAGPEVPRAHGTRGRAQSAERPEDPALEHQE